jgi:molybdopterin converting factor small subunit
VAIVVFSGSLARHTEGVERVEIEARRVVDLVKTLGDRYPALRGQIEDMAVAIDDEIHNDASFLRLEADSVVHFVPRIGGG